MPCIKPALCCISIYMNKHNKSIKAEGLDYVFIVLLELDYVFLVLLEQATDIGKADQSSLSRIQPASALSATHLGLHT